MSIVYTYITAVNSDTGVITLDANLSGTSSVSKLYVYPAQAAVFLQGADSDTLETLSDQLDLAARPGDPMTIARRQPEGPG